MPCSVFFLVMSCNAIQCNAMSCNVMQYIYIYLICICIQLHFIPYHGCRPSKLALILIFAG